MDNDTLTQFLEEMTDGSLELDQALIDYGHLLLDTELDQAYRDYMESRTAVKKVLLRVARTNDLTEAEYMLY